MAGTVTRWYDGCTAEFPKGVTELWNSAVLSSHLLSAAISGRSILGPAPSNYIPRS